MRRPYKINLVGREFETPDLYCSLSTFIIKTSLQIHLHTFHYRGTSEEYGVEGSGYCNEYRNSINVFN